MPAERGIVEITGQRHCETNKSKFTADRLCFPEIYSDIRLWGHQFYEGTTVLGDNDAFATRGGGSGFGETCFDLAYREFHGATPLASPMGDNAKWIT